MTLVFKPLFACILGEPSLLCGSKVMSTLSVGVQWRDPKLLWGSCQCRFQKQLPQVWRQHKTLCSATLQVLVSQVQRGCLCPCSAAALLALQMKLLLSEPVLQTAICVKACERSYI